jgi:C-terminal processing protease CtpA/Prc
MNALVAIACVVFTPRIVLTIFSECVAAQVGVKSGDSIISVNGLAVAEQNAARVSEAILKTVSDLHLEIEREISTTGSSKFSKQRAQETQSPRKIQKFNLSDDEELENNVNSMEESKPEGRLGGIDNLLKFDEGLKPLRLLADGRDFVYSGAVFASISGTYFIIDFLSKL